MTKTQIFGFPILDNRTPNQEDAKVYVDILGKFGSIAFPLGGNQWFPFATISYDPRFNESHDHVEPDGLEVWAMAILSVPWGMSGLAVDGLQEHFLYFRSDGTTRVCKGGPTSEPDRLMTYQEAAEFFLENFLEALTAYWSNTIGSLKGD